MTNMLGYADMQTYLEELYSFTIFMFNVHPHLSRFPTVIHSLFAWTPLTLLESINHTQLLCLKRHQTKFTTPMRATPCKKLDHVTTVYTHICHISWEGTQQIWCNKTIWVNILYVFYESFFNPFNHSKRRKNKKTHIVEGDMPCAKFSNFMAKWPSQGLRTVSCLPLISSLTHFLEAPGHAR